MTSETIPFQERPLITFALVAYKQERFIRDAVKGALAQTYEPLEIIISDDCSPDGTFQVIQEITAEYSGPHKIILNRNEMNGGIGININRIMELSNGELIVIAAGDDISLPSRTAETYQAWLDSDKKAFSLYSEFEMIDEYGMDIAESNIRKKEPLPKDQQLLFFSKTLSTRVPGCTHAWHRQLFDLFGPLPSIILEDHAIPPRAMLLGRVVSIPKTLVKYRTHQDNAWASSTKFSVEESLDKNICYSKDRITICDDVIRCINEYKCAVKDLSRVRELDECISAIETGRERNKFRITILTGHPILRVFRLLTYARLYGFHKNDLFWVVCAFSVSVARLLLHCKRRKDKCLKH
jgi:glycosyltransferase involved in cell wall biosynthesis